MGGNLYRGVSNRKNRDPYFNLVKKDIIDSSENTITLDNGHVLIKSDLAIKGKILPGPKKIIVNQTPTGHKPHTHSSLAGKKRNSHHQRKLYRHPLGIRVKAPQERPTPEQGSVHRL